MCMASNLMAMPGNAIGGLWGDEDLGDKITNASIAGKFAQSSDKAMSKALFGEQQAPQPQFRQDLQQVQDVSPQSRRSRSSILSS